MNIFFETDRLLVREILPTDLEGMFELDSDPEVHRYLGNKPVSTRDESLAMIDSIRQQYTDHGIGRWAMVEKSGGDFIGWTGLKYITQPVNGHVHYYDVGYRLLKRHWGKGYATESATGSVKYGFEKLKADDLYAFADLGNKTSIHILQKAGFKLLETFNYMDIPHQWMKLSRQDWNSYNSGN